MINPMIYIVEAMRGVAIFGFLGVVYFALRVIAG